MHVPLPPFMSPPTNDPSPPNQLLLTRTAHHGQAVLSASQPPGAAEEDCPLCIACVYTVNLGLVSGSSCDSTPVLTVSPMKVYLGHLTPTTPANAGPVCIPIRIRTRDPSGAKFESAAASMSCQRSP